MVDELTKLEKIVLEILNVVDYDIYKESLWNLEEEGYDDLVDSISIFIRRNKGKINEAIT